MVQIIASRPQKKDDIDPDSARQSLHRWWRRQKNERLDDARNRYQERTHSRSSARSVSVRDYAAALGVSESLKDSMRAIGTGKEMSGIAASIANLGIHKPSAIDAISKLQGQSAAIAASMAHLQSPSMSAALAMQKEADRIKKMINPLGYTQIHQAPEF
jgi:hypothetical protein